MWKRIEPFRRGLIALLTLAALCVFLIGSAAAEEIIPYTLEKKRVSASVGDSFVEWPVLKSSSADGAAVAGLINRQIREDGQIYALIGALGSLTEGGTGLKVRCDAELREDVLTVVLNIKGKMPVGRPSQRYIALTYDLQTGEKIDIRSLVEVKDEALLLSRLEEAAEELLAYAEAGSAEPIPWDQAALLHGTLTFYYPNDQFSLISGDSAAISLTRDELRDIVAFGDAWTSAQMTAEAYQSMLSIGMLPDVWCDDDVLLYLGAPMEPILSACVQTIDPSDFPDGFLLETENPYLRGMLLITDRSMETLAGILLKRGAFCGLSIGFSDRAMAEERLGAPEQTVSLSRAAAEAYGLSGGNYMIYEIPGVSRGDAVSLWVGLDDRDVIQEILVRRQE